MQRTKKRFPPKRKVKALQRFVRPNFDPVWTEDEALPNANKLLAQDHSCAAGFRVACIVMAKTPEGLMKSALSENDGTKIVCEWLDNTEKDLEFRLELVRAARLRVLATAAYVYGVD